MLRHHTALVGLALALLMSAQAYAATTAVVPLRHAISYHRAKTWYYQDRAGVARTRSVFAEKHTTSPAYLKWINNLWQRRLRVARHLSRRYPPHHSLWMCEHSHEAGNWHDHDSGGNRHYGGLQMHWSWGYGIVGDAGDYSQVQQEWAAERGLRANHFSRDWVYGQWAHYDCLAYL